MHKHTEVLTNGDISDRHSVHSPGHLSNDLNDPDNPIDPDDTDNPDDDPVSNSQDPEDERYQTSLK